MTLAGSCFLWLVNCFSIHLLAVLSLLFDLTAPTCPPLLNRAPLPRPLRAWSNMCVISNHYSFVWIPIPKTGSSSMRNLLARALCCQPGEAGGQACGAGVEPVMMQQVRAWTLKIHLFQGCEPMPSLRILSV